MPLLVLLGPLAATGRAAATMLGQQVEQVGVCLWLITSSVMCPTALSISPV